MHSADDYGAVSMAISKEDQAEGKGFWAGAGTGW